MKTNKTIELDVDFIGGERTLTKEEEKSINEYLLAKHNKATKKKSTKKSISKLDDVDVVFDPTPLTKEEKQLISEFIRKDKSKRAKADPKKSTKKSKLKLAA